ncbi:MAG: 50S ribosomal protein L24 [Candidatus Saccharimonadales bacterium]
MRIRMGDTIIVRAGKDKGKVGTVSKVIPGLNKVVVDGINIVKRATKPTQKQPKGGIFEVAAPIDVSNVGLVHPDEDKRSSRVGYVIKDGAKKRVYKQAGKKEVK